MPSLQQEIKQSKFKNSIEKAMVNILYTANWIIDAEMPIFKVYGIQPQHFNVLKIVKGKHPEPASPSQILAVMLDKGRDLTRLVDKLVKLEMLRRETCPTNRRKVDIYITEKGIALTHKMENEIDVLFAQLGNRITEPEAEQLSNLIDKIRG